MYTDPSGHVACSSVAEEDCSFESMSAEEVVKKNIKVKYGITMSDDGYGAKAWTINNLRLIFSSLQNINNALNGNLKSFSQGWTFRMKNQQGNGDYHGETSTDGTMTIDFFTIGTDAIRQINIYHEVGHLLDNVTGMEDTFTNAVNNADDDSWMSGDTINSNALLTTRIYDPNYGDAQAIQGILTVGASDQWADAFANYVAGNIRMGDNGPGDAMYTFVHDTLTPYTGTP
jgi:hypothetical protein